MADFEDFLIVEFSEQHNNMRQIETSMTQMIQGFFTIEGVVVAGALGLFSINASVSQLVVLMVPIFWILFLFGHLTYNVSIYSFVSILVIDFQNTIARKYFAGKYDKENYLYFMLNPEAESGGKPGQWEKVQDNRSATAKFVGTVNTVNLTIAIATSTYAIAAILFSPLDVLAIVTQNFVLVLAAFVMLFIVLHKGYHRAMFVTTVRREEQVTLARRHELLNRISKSALSTNNA